MGPLALNYPKCGSSRFKRSKVWELLFQASESVGAIALKHRNRLNCRQADHIKTEASWCLAGCFFKARSYHMFMQNSARAPRLMHF